MAGGERSGWVARPVGQAALAVPVVLYHKKKKGTVEQKADQRLIGADVSGVGVSGRPKRGVDEGRKTRLSRHGVCAKAVGDAVGHVSLHQLFDVTALIKAHSVR